MFEGLNLLVIKYSSLGDVINAVPAVRLLKRNCPDSRIYWLLNREYEGLLSGARYIDEIVVYGGRGLGATLDVVRKIRSLRIDVVIDLQGLFKSGLIGYLSGARERVCFPHTREFSSIFYTRRLGLERGSGVHAVVENASVVEELVDGRAGATYEFDLPVDEAAIERAGCMVKDGTGGDGPLVVISPTSRWATKRWGAERFARLGDLLAGDGGARVVFTGAAGDLDYIEGIREGMKNPALNLAGKTDIKTLVAVLKAADLVVSCDSGPMHIASAVGTPVVAIFGPTDPGYTGPFGGRSVVITSGAECSPCRRRRCEDMRCMKDIRVEEVYEKAVRSLEGHE